MARIAGVNIPTQKRVVIALTYITGIGPAKAKEITTKVGIPAERRVSQLTDAEVVRIREVIDQDYTVEGAGDYYLIPKRTNQETVTEPYFYKINGQDVLMASFVVPVQAGTRGSVKL